MSIRRLETLELVKRSRDPADLRLVLVDTTPKGLALHRESLADMRASAVQRLRRLSQAELDALTKALAPLERLAGSADRRTPATAVRSALRPSPMLSRPAPRASGR
jgi:DNA-binding MarR family transcriptional regulator